MRDYDIILSNSVKRGSSRIANISKQIANYRDATRRIGGFWNASFIYGLNRDDRDDMFLNGLMRDVKRTSGGVVGWEGLVSSMQYTRDGIQWRRDVTEVVNSVKVLYTRIFDNILTNGSAESGAWTVYNGATVTQSTTWVSDGAYSCKIVVADAAIRGATIQTGITLEADTAYNFQIQVNAISGSWRIQINKVSDDSKVVAASTRSATGVQQFNLTIAPNTYVGDVYVRITSEAAAGTIYADAAVLQVAPQAADTGWVQNSDSISEYGRIDSTIIEGALSSAAASARAASFLNRQSWARVTPPDAYSLIDPGEDQLIVNCSGYVQTLLWKMNSLYTTASMSSIVTQLCTGLDYVTAGIIDTNSVSYTIENRMQLSVWQILKTLVNSGDASGNRWSLGVYANRKLNYTQTTSDLAYHYRRGRLYNIAGGEMEPWLVAPGWSSLDDAPIVPGSITASRNDDIRRAFLEETEFISPNGIAFKSRVAD